MEKKRNFFVFRQKNKMGHMGKRKKWAVTEYTSVSVWITIGRHRNFVVENPFLC